MKFSLIFLFILSFSSCEILHHFKSNADSSDLVNNNLSLKIECVQNAMPMTNSLPYVIVVVCPADTIINENFRIVEMIATGENGSWKAQSFDHDEYFGKGLHEYINIARDLDRNIGTRFDFKVTIQFESGVRQNYEVKGVTTRVVS